MNAGSTHARATSRAPFAGVRDTSQSMRARMSSSRSTPFSINRSARARARRGGRGFDHVADRVVVVVVVVVVVGHVTSSNQCS